MKQKAKQAIRLELSITTMQEALGQEHVMKQLQGKAIRLELLIMTIY